MANMQAYFHFYTQLTELPRTKIAYTSILLRFGVNNN